MKRPTSIYKKGQLFVSAVFALDILLCFTLLILVTLLLVSENLQPRIIKDEIVEQFSLPASIIGFCLAAILMLNMRYFVSSFRGTLLFLRISFLAGMAHLICALALIFYCATHLGQLTVYLGHIYRDYG
ncbi:MAG: hypothetical protein JSW00_00370 [Thermoplasmata archaeon]|nr:MAG: hypothetical protein JSW00_00370 [Thermoplasmata archaeon]